MFSLAQHHKYSIGDIENLIVYERDIYVKMLSDYLELKRLEDKNMRNAASSL